MPRRPAQGDSHGNLLWKIVENTFAGGGGGGIGPAGAPGADGVGTIGAAIAGSTPDRVLQTGPLGQLESGAVTTTELGFLAGATSNLQVQINALSGGVPGIESLADATGMWITDEENFGIGTPTPSAMLEIKARAPLAGAGTISSSGVTVTGVGSAFLTQLRVGYTITVAGQTATVRTITSDTLLTVSYSFAPVIPALSSWTYQIAMQNWIDSSGNLKGVIDSRGRLFIGSPQSGTASNAVASFDIALNDPSESVRGAFSRVVANATVASNINFSVGMSNIVTLAATNTQNWTNASALVGLLNTAIISAGASGVITGAHALSCQVSNASPSCTIIDSILIRESAPSTGGVYTNFAGISLQNHTVATNNTNLLIGTNNVIPSGNWSIYNSSAYVNYFEGSFGIGTSVPDGKLHVFSGSGGTITPQVFADELVLESNGNVGMSLLSPNTAVASICFGDPEDNDAGSFNYNHAVDVLSAQVGGVEFLYLMSTKRVGIGISTPDGTLHVMTSSIGAATADPNADDLVVENNGPCGISILSINNDQAVLSFGDVDDQDIGQIVYENNGDSMLFICNTFNTMTIVASQRVGIKTNAPDGTLHVLSASAGTVTASATADDLTLENSDHCGISILCPADKVGVIFFGDPDDNDIGQISYNHAVDTLTLTAGTVNVVNCISTACNPGSDNAISLGNAGNRWTEVFAVAPIINTSDAREKNSISGVSLNLALDLLDKITPRSYVWNNTRILGTHYGFVAQEIESAARAAGLVPGDFGPLHYDRENDRYGLRESELLPFLWRVVQDQQKRIQTLEYAYGH